MCRSARGAGQEFGAGSPVLRVLWSVDPAKRRGLCAKERCPGR